MKLVIDYLLEEDRQSYPGYRAAAKMLQKFNVFKIHKAEDFLQLIASQHSHQEELIITIIAHGHSRGITVGTFESLISWCELANSINKTRTNFPVKLNLMSICESNRITPYRDALGKDIDQIWINNSEVISVEKALLASEKGDFNNFICLLEEEEQELYCSV